VFSTIVVFISFAFFVAQNFLPYDMTSKCNSVLFRVFLDRETKKDLWSVCLHGSSKSTAFRSVYLCVCCQWSLTRLITPQRAPAGINSAPARSPFVAGDSYKVHGARRCLE